MKNKEGKKLTKIQLTGKILSWVFTGLFGAFFVFFAVGFVLGRTDKKNNYNQNLIYGYGNFIVQTDSMEPEYPVNTAIVTHKDSPASIYKEWESISHSTTKEKHIDLTFMDCYEGSFTSASKIDELKDTYTEETSNINRVITHRLRYIVVDETKKEGEGRYLFYVAGINTSAHQAEKGQYQVCRESQFSCSWRIQEVHCFAIWTCCSSSDSGFLCHHFLWNRCLSCGEGTGRERSICFSW